MNRTNNSQKPFAKQIVLMDQITWHFYYLYGIPALFYRLLSSISLFERNYIFDKTGNPPKFEKGTLIDIKTVTCTASFSIFSIIQVFLRINSLEFQIYDVGKATSAWRQVDPQMIANYKRPDSISLHSRQSQIVQFYAWNAYQGRIWINHFLRRFLIPLFLITKLTYINYQVYLSFISISSLQLFLILFQARHKASQIQNFIIQKQIGINFDFRPAVVIFTGKMGA